MKRIIYFLLLFVGVSCVKYSDPTRALNSGREASESEATYPTFDTLPNPYAISTAQSILDSLGVDIEIMPSHKYVKIISPDSLQMTILEDSLDMALFEHPLDLDIPNDTEYIDVTFVEDEPTCYYTVVKYDFEFPEGVNYEILKDEIFIPEPDFMVQDLEGNMVEFEELLYERIGYVSSGPQTRGSGGKKPKGRVLMHDKLLGIDVPVKHVRVKIYNFLHIDDVWTNDEGYFYADEKFYANTVRYTVVYLNKQDNFVVRCTGGSRAKYQLGKHGYDYTIKVTENSKGDAWRWTAIYNAAWDYYDMCKDRDNNIAILPGTAKIWYKSYEKTSGFPGSARIVNIGGKERNNAELYYLVNHELAHTSHYAKVGWDKYWLHYSNYISKCFLLDGNVYGNGKRDGHGYCEVGEMWGNIIGRIEYCEKYNQARLADVFYSSSKEYYYSYWHGSLDKSPYYFYRPGIGDWIHPDPLWALITRGGMTKKQIFDCLTSDVTSKEKLQAKLISRHPDKKDLINEAFKDDNIIFPKGPDNAYSNQYVNFSSPEKLYSGAVFREYRVSSNGAYKVFGDLYTPKTTINLPSNVEYTITAVYTMPDGSAVELLPGKKVDQRLAVKAAEPLVPLIYASMDLSEDIYVGAQITFSVFDPDPELIYEWEHNYMPVDEKYGNGTSSITIPVQKGGNAGGATVTCRARNSSSIVSGWSDILWMQLYSY